MNIGGGRKKTAETVVVPGERRWGEGKAGRVRYLSRGGGEKKRGGSRSRGKGAGRLQAAMKRDTARKQRNRAKGRRTANERCDIL